MPKTLRVIRSHSLVYWVGPEKVRSMTKISSPSGDSVGGPWR
jgi:hypothetical protein